MYTVLEGVDSVCVVRPSYFEFTVGGWNKRRV
jgi:hypothetical protein